MKESIPLHPGVTVRKACLDANKLTVADGARLLGVTRQALNNLVNGKAGLSPEMAVRLAKVFGGDDESWLQLQLVFDLAQVRKRADAIVAQCATERPHFKKELRPL